MNWSDMYARALSSSDVAAGYYNRNVCVTTSSGLVNVRIPLEAADDMDVRLWAEEDVLRSIAGLVENVPRARHVSTHPRFQVQTFIEGQLLDVISPRKAEVPHHVMWDVVTLMSQLRAVPAERVPAIPVGWPASGDTPAFGRRLARTTWRIYEEALPCYERVYRVLGVPEDPLAVVAPEWGRLGSRSFALLHSDLHRKNMIVADGHTWFLDWELALWGDPVYELAVHFHKMDYPEEQRAAVLRQWLVTMTGITHDVMPDLEIYLAHEQIKSALVDTVRYSKQLAVLSTDTAAALVGRLCAKVNRARRVWGLEVDVAPRQVAEALRPWAEGKHGRAALV